MGDYKHSRFTITQLVVNEILKGKAENAELLLLVAHVSAEDIPRNLLNHLADPLVVDEFIHTLKKYSLVMSEHGMSEKYFFTLHRLTQSIIRQCLALSQNKDCQFPMDKLNDYVSLQIENKRYTTITKIVPHLEVIAQHFPKAELALGMLYYHTGSYKNAAAVIEKCLSCHQYDPEELCNLYFYAGQAYKEMLQCDKSKEAFWKGISLCQKHFPNNAGKLVHFYTQLASLHRWQKDLDATQQLCELALFVYEKAENKREEEIMETYIILGGMYREKGQFARAEEHFLKGIDMYKRHLNSHEQDYARALLMLGQTYIDQGLYEKALPLYEESLITHEKQLSPSDVKLSWCYVRLGGLYRLLKRNEKALEYLKKSDQSSKDDSASHRMRWGQMARELAYIHAENKEFDKAQTYAEQSREIFANYYGAKGIRTMCINNLLGYIHLLKGEIDKAETYLQDANKYLAEHQHSSRFISLIYLSDICIKRASESQGNKYIALKDKALDYLNQSLAIVDSYFAKDSLHAQNIKRKIDHIQKTRNFTDFSTSAMFVNDIA